jgi:YesN/AraC family two-component response regulator
LPLDAIRANKYRQLALKHWRVLPRTLLTKLANLRCHVVWAPTVPAPAHAFELRIPVIIDDGIIGFAFLLRIDKVKRKSSRAHFGAAATLLRLFVRYVEAATSLELRTMALAKANQQTAEHKHEETQLRVDLNRKLPGIFVMAGREEEESHTEQLVHRMLDYIQKEYTRPITLKECAHNLEFNAAYLCALFSHTIGLPFKSYLTRLRLEKARELLSDPTRRVSDVAFAVGYSSANRFRLAFKAATGLAPVTWRSSLRT